MDAITVTAVIEARSGMERELAAALCELVEPTRREDGCLQYELHRADDSPRLFMSFERWRSQDDLDRHLAQPYVMAFHQRSDDLLTQRPDVTVWRSPEETQRLECREPLTATAF